MPLTGGCRCGACRHSLDYDALPATYACHCRDCQTMSGGAVAIQAIVPLGKLAFSGETIAWERANPRGAATAQYFCAACKTRLYSSSASRPAVALLRAGTLDDSDGLNPAVHIWLRRKQPWIRLPDGAETYPENAPGDRMMTLFAPNLI